MSAKNSVKLYVRFHKLFLNKIHHSSNKVEIIEYCGHCGRIHAKISKNSAFNAVRNP